MPHVQNKGGVVGAFILMLITLYVFEEHWFSIYGSRLLLKSIYVSSIRVDVKI